METPDPPNDTPQALKQVATWHPMTSLGFLGLVKYHSLARLDSLSP